MKIVRRHVRSPLFFLSAFFIFFVVDVSCPRAQLRIYDTFNRHYIVRNLGEDSADSNDRRFFHLCEFTIRMEEGKLNGKPVYVIHRQDKTPQGDKYDWKFYVDRNSLASIQNHVTITSRQGKVLEDKTEYYGNHFHNFGKNSFPLPMLPVAIQYMDLTLKEAQTYHFMFRPEVKGWTIFFTVDGEESITVPAGTFECVRVKIEYSKDSLPSFIKILPSFIMKRLLSDFYLWVLKDEPHTMIRLQGKLEGFSQPEKSQELVKIER